MLRTILIMVSLAAITTAAHGRPLAHGPSPGGALPAHTVDAPGIMATQQRREREPGPANLEEAIEIALERYGGRAADAETVVREGRRVHEIRVLGEDGSVRTVRVDPETGAIIPQRRRPD